MVSRFLLFLSLVLLTACGSSLPASSARTAASESRTVYVVPFDTAMVPPQVEEGLFDLVVDLLNEKGKTRGFDFVILKQGTQGVDPAWLANQLYITGEILGYVEDSGCCSTAIRLKGRARLHRPGVNHPDPALEIPREVFFEHDYSTLEEERRKLVTAVASALADSVLSALSSH